MKTLLNRVSASQASKRRWRSGLRDALRSFFLHRHFALLWTGQTVSSFGSYITGIGLPVIALLLLHATPAQIGLLAALGALPGLCMGLFIGVWVDRLPRRPVLLAADLGRALLLASIPLITALGLLHFAWLAVIAVLTGFFSVSFEVASLSFLPALLQPGELFAGNSRLATSSSLAEIAGPPLAGLLIQLLTAPLAILLDSLSFLFSALCVSLIRLPDRSESLPVHSSGRARLGREMRAGLGYVLRDPILRVLAAYAGTQSFFGGAFAALYLVYAFQLFSANPLLYSLLVACGGLGALIGSFGANWCARRLGAGRTLIGSALLFGMLAFCTPIAAGPALVVFLLLALSQFIGDFGFSVYAIGEISLRQQLVPQHLLGRVNACMHILSNGIMPLGAILAGLLSEAIGVRLTLLVGSAGLFLASGWLLFSPLRRYR